jgi:hypothetical protein
MKPDAQDAIRPVRSVTLDKAIDERIDGIAKWLAQNAHDCREHAHLDEGSPERAYWHHGYLAALRDMRDLLHGRKDSIN